MGVLGPPLPPPRPRRVLMAQHPGAHPSQGRQRQQSPPVSQGGGNSHEHLTLNIQITYWQK